MDTTDKAAEALRLADAMGGYSPWDDKVAAMLREYAALLQAQPAEAGRVPPSAPSLEVEREAFENFWPPWPGVRWSGETYQVVDEYASSYRAESHVSAWRAWRARAALSLPKERP